MQREAYEAFSEQQTERVPAWKKMVHDYEDDPKKKNPYEMVVKGSWCAIYIARYAE